MAYMDEHVLDGEIERLRSGARYWRERAGIERETSERLRGERDKLRSVLVVLTAWGRCDIPNTMGAMAEIIMEADAALRATAKEKDNG